MSPLVSSTGLAVLLVWLRREWNFWALLVGV